MARKPRVHFPGALYPLPAGAMKIWRRRWRDKQDHTGKRGDANKIALTSNLFLKWIGRRFKGESF